MTGRRAFTLIELLMVLAIIAILAAMLMPALRSARNRSARMLDLSNLHQVIIALHAYAGDSRDSVPWPNWDYGQALPGGPRPGWLYMLDVSVPGTNVFKVEDGLLWSYLRNGKVFLCPMDEPDRVYSGDEHRQQRISSYIMNGAVIGFRSGFKSNSLPVKVSQMRSDDCILFEADEGEAFNFNDGSSWPPEGITARHAHGGTLAALDGSAAGIRSRDWQVECDDTNKNRLWCFPGTPDGGDINYGHSP